MWQKGGTMNFTITVRSTGILAAMNIGDPRGPHSKLFDVGHEGPAFEAACAELAGQIAQLKEWGISEFHFAKTDDVDLPTLYRVATRIASQVPGTRTPLQLN